MASSARPGSPAMLDALPRPSKTVEQFAAEQGVGPVHDLDELSALWPAEDDPDAFDEFIRQLRAERREAVRRRRLPGG